MSLSWETYFRKGVDAFRSLDYQNALQLFDAAIARGGERYTVYDSRAAVHEKMGKRMHALKDSRKVIELAPHMRHGYTRSARLFLSIGNHDNALEMARLALERIKASDIAHRSEMEALRCAIHEAKETHITKEAQRNTYAAKLPVELVSEVFFLAADVDPGSPVRVSHVCSQWRAIALSSPRLWSHIELSDVRPVRKMELWQERSKRRIRSLRIHARISHPQLQDALAKCSPEFCRELRFLHSDIDLVTLWSSFLNIPNFVSLNLEEICVSPGRSFRIQSPSPLIPFPGNSNLRSIIVEYVDVDWAIVPSLAHLRTLVIRTNSELPSITLIWKLLASNAHLEDLILEAGSPSWDSVIIGTNERIQLLELSQLRLLGPMKATPVTSRLYLPNLKRLVISHCLDMVDKAMFALDPSFPVLTELSIYKCSFSEDRLVSLLRRMQTLIKLEITHSGSLTDVVIEAIAGSIDERRGESKLVCPALQHVDFSHSPNLNGGPVVRFVKSRLRDTTEVTISTMALPAKIRVLNIDGCPKIDPAVPEWLKGRIQNVSCVYMTRADLKKLSRRDTIHH